MLAKVYHMDPPCTLCGRPKTRARLEAAGAEVLEYDGREISLKGGGGPTCLTRPIVRDPGHSLGNAF